MLILWICILAGLALGLCANVAALLLAAWLTVVAVVGQFALDGGPFNWRELALMLVALNAGYFVSLLAEVGGHALTLRRAALQTPRRPFQ